MLQDILNKIVAYKKQEVTEKKKTAPLAGLKIHLAQVDPPRDFRTSILSHLPVSIIAEIKRRSPSAGIIREDLDARELAQTYEQHGASAISVLIDRNFFGGSLEDLRMVKEAVSLPVLAKEFMVDAYQMYEARCSGADAILLIARLLTGEEISRFYHIASDLGMACMMEIHSVEEIEKIAHLPATSVIVGINNRDLNSFTVDVHTTEKIVATLPSSWVIVSESGIKNARDIQLLTEKGVHIFLVGEAIVRSSDPARTLRELCRG